MFTALARITELAGHLNAANRRWLALIAEFDRRKGWHDGLTQSCAHWLNWKCGTDMAAETSVVARRADAVGLVAESFLKHGPEALSGGERHHIVVHVDAETLQAREHGRCELDDGPAIPVETARRLSCDASVVP